MDASDRRTRIGYPIGLALLGLAVCGCASGRDRPEPLAPQTLTEFEPTPAEEDPPAEVLAAEREAAERAAGSAPGPDSVSTAVTADDLGEPSFRSTTVIEGREVAAPASTNDLLAASRAAREQRRTGEKAKIVIDDNNLSDYADVPLTTAQPSSTSAGGASPTSPRDGATGTGSLAGEAPEDYWRGRMLDLRLAWRDAYDRATELESEIASLRRQFYTTDDPFVRDGRIRPAWDRAIGQLQEVEASLIDLRLEVERGLDEGRRAGALPGWLREGIELEPPSADEESEAGRPSREPGEPEIVDEGSGR